MQLLHWPDGVLARSHRLNRGSLDQYQKGALAAAAAAAAAAALGEPESDWRPTGSFTYFTAQIERRVGRVNDSVALHYGNVGLDNLQLRMNHKTTRRGQTTRGHDDDDDDAGWRHAGKTSKREARLVRNAPPQKKNGFRVR